MAVLNDSPAERLSNIEQKMAQAVARFDDTSRKVCLVAVSKTFPVEDILPLLDAGQRVFGENRVQEAKDKWPGLKADYPDVELHLIGPLQTNKAREAVCLFDVIESLDREKLARVLREEMDRAQKELPLFVQVNIGGEDQKAGIAPDQALSFVKLCQDTYCLNIRGLMCIPPAGEAPGPYFAQLYALASQAGLAEVSMGMSSDFETAIAMGATTVRVGSALFGGRG